MNTANPSVEIDHTFTSFSYVVKIGTDSYVVKDGFDAATGRQEVYDISRINKTSTGQLNRASDEWQRVERLFQENRNN